MLDVMELQRKEGRLYYQEFREETSKKHTNKERGVRNHEENIEMMEAEAGGGKELRIATNGGELL